MAPAVRQDRTLHDLTAYRHHGSIKASISCGRQPRLPVATWSRNASRAADQGQVALEFLSFQKPGSTDTSLKVSFFEGRFKGPWPCISERGCSTCALLNQGGEMRLREVLQQHETIIAPGAYDAVSARIIEKAGFPVLYMTDLGMLGDFYSLGEYDRIVKAVHAPVIAVASCHGLFARQADISVDAWRRVGIKMVLYWHLPLFAAMKAVTRAVLALQERGTTAQMQADLFSYAEYEEVMQLQECLACPGFRWSTRERVSNSRRHCHNRSVTWVY